MRHDPSVPHFYACPPASPSNSPSIFPSLLVTFSPTVRPRKSFSGNTCGSLRKCCKQKTCCKSNSFKCNTYKNQGGGVSASHVSTFNPYKHSHKAPNQSLFLSYTYKCPLPQPLSFDILTNAGGGIPFSAIIPPRTSEAS